jgi:hypothetical protein
MRRLIAALALVAGTAWGLEAQERRTIHYWAFNEIADGAAWGAEIPASVGTGVISHTFQNTTSFIGMTLNAEPTYPAGRDFGVPARSGLVNNGRSFTIRASTEGYDGIVMNTATRRTAEGYTSQAIAYSVDGGQTFTSVTTINDLPIDTYVTREVSFAGVQGAANNPNFQIRVTVTGATHASGNNRWDNLRITGTVAAAPAAPAPPAPPVQEPPVQAPAEQVEAPVVIEPEENNVAVGSPVVVEATPSTPETVSEVEFSVDGGPYQPAPQVSGESEYQIVVGPFPTPGVRTVCVRVRRAGRGVGQPTCTPVTVYDPNPRQTVSHVTGGGWVPFQGERANFGFVVRRTAQGAFDGNLQLNWREGRGQPRTFRATAVSFEQRQDGSVVITGTGTLDRTAGVPFTAVVSSNPDRFGISIPGQNINIPDSDLRGGDITVHR